MAIPPGTSVGMLQHLDALTRHACAAVATTTLTRAAGVAVDVTQLFFGCVLTPGVSQTAVFLPSGETVGAADG